MYHAEVSKFPACEPEVSNVLSLVGFWRWMWLKTLLREVGSPFETDKLL